MKNKILLPIVYEVISKILEGTFDQKEIISYSEHSDSDNDLVSIAIKKPDFAILRNDSECIEINTKQISNMFIIQKKYVELLKKHFFENNLFLPFAKNKLEKIIEDEVSNLISKMDILKIGLNFISQIQVNLYADINYIILTEIFIKNRNNIPMIKPNRFISTCNHLNIKIFGF